MGKEGHVDAGRVASTKEGGNDVRVRCCEVEGDTKFGLNPGLVEERFLVENREDGREGECHVEGRQLKSC
jgi:hypothetical protein